jgi:hypothetical protein
MNDARTDGLERTVNLLLDQVAALSAEVSRLGQTIWQMATITASGGGGGAVVRAINSGTISAVTAGVQGSGNVTLQTLDPASGLLTAGAVVLAWSGSSVAITQTDLLVELDAQGNYWVCTGYC